MAVSIRSLLRERKYTIIFATGVLLLLFLIHVSTSGNGPAVAANRFFSFYSPPTSSSAAGSGMLTAASSPTLPPPPRPVLYRPPPVSLRGLISPPPPLLPANPAVTTLPVFETTGEVQSDPGGSLNEAGGEGTVAVEWKICTVGRGVSVADYIPCLDNMKAIKELPSRRHMEHRERHCPKPSPRCLVPIPPGYRTPVPWPESRDKIWFRNVPHTKLVEYKKDQNWVRASGDYLIFPGGGTQFKGGVGSYADFIEQTFPTIEWGGRTRVVLDVGCGVASFGGYLLDKEVITMSVAPKDEHEAQIQFALERGIPAVLEVIGTQRLPFPDNAYDLVHCARCRVHWDGDGGKPLMELNRVLRPGGFFVWSATPVYRDDTRNQDIWNAMVALTESICWRTVIKAQDAEGIGLVVYQKPFSNACYKERRENIPPTCDFNYVTNMSWYIPLDGCLPPIPEYATGEEDSSPTSWPERLISKPINLGSQIKNAEETFFKDTESWKMLVSNTYFQAFGINWSKIRNVMDMNARLGGFAAALAKNPLWVMNVVPVGGPDTLSTIFDRGLIGIYHDWCESFNTYPRSYDLLHSSYLFQNITNRCDITDSIVEMDRILRPGGWVLVQETADVIRKMLPIFRSLHWETTVYSSQFLVGRKGSWRPSS